MIAAMLSVVFLIVATIIYVRYDERSVKGWHKKEAERLYWKNFDDIIEREEAVQRKVETRRFVRACSEESYVEAEFARIRLMLAEDIKITWPPKRGDT